MRTIKVSRVEFEAAVKRKADNCQFMHIPSSNKNHVFVGLMMPGGVWVAWPNDLNEEEMKLYIEKYGNVPDLFTPKPASTAKEYVVKDHRNDIFTDPTKAREYLRAAYIDSAKTMPLFPIEMRDGRIIDADTATTEDIFMILRTVEGSINEI